jgi:hypothetical protein
VHTTVRVPAHDGLTTMKLMYGELGNERIRTLFGLPTRAPRPARLPRAASAVATASPRVAEPMGIAQELSEALRKHRVQHALDRIQLPLDLRHAFQLQAQLLANVLELVLNCCEDL